jgi:hypothetical protein
MKQLPHKYVYNARGEVIGEAGSIGEAKEIHIEYYKNSPLKDLYAGVDCSGDLFPSGYWPMFYKG